MITSLYPEKLDINYLSKFLNSNKLVLRPKTLAYLTTIWSTLDPADQGNLLSAMKREATSNVQLNEHFIFTLSAIKQVLEQIGIISSTEAKSTHTLAINLARKQFWKEAWDLICLDGGEDANLSMLEWMGRTKIKLSHSKRA